MLWAPATRVTQKSSNVVTFFIRCLEKETKSKGEQMGNQKTRESAERLTSWNRGSEEESVIDFILRYTLLLCPSNNPSDATQILTSSSSHSHPPSSVKLSVEWRKLVEVPGELFDYRYLENLSLAFNKICELPNSFRRFGRLTELCLASNQLTSFPTVLYSLTQLRILSLGGNSIQSLPDAMFVELGIFHNQSLQRADEFYLLSIPSVGLQQLQLVANGLTEVSVSFSKLTNLNALSLSNNKIAELPLDCFPSSLETLDLAANLLTNIDFGEHTLEGLSSRLSSLELRENHLNELPSSFTRLNALVKV